MTGFEMRSGTGPAGGNALPDHEVRRLRSVASTAEDPDAAYRQLVRRRLEGEPLQYLEGTAAFGPFDLVVDPRVLVPRPETEQLWELACRTVAHPGVIVDLGTGSGALAVALARRFPKARVVAVDASAAAADVARLNADRLDVRVDVVVGDLFQPLPPDLAGTVDLLVSNPPYVADSEWAQLPADVRREPRSALVAGPTGTEILDRIAREVPRWLAPGGWVLCEIGAAQGAHCRREFEEAGLADVEIRADLTGRDRFVMGRR
jgi:release factor glutamine methyltransferase